MILNIDFTGLDWHQAQNVFERHFLIRSLQYNNFNVSKTAKKINLQRSHIYVLIKKYNINVALLQRPEKVFEQSAGLTPEPGTQEKDHNNFLQV